jgi:superfamily I DNA/RNA helicase/RecB family exonuclease
VRNFSDSPDSSETELPVELAGVMAGLDALVLGSPGSGKTGLIKNLVSEFEIAGLNPSEIIVITPQRAAATRLRDQLASNSKKVAILPRARSVTSLAFEILQAELPGVKLVSGAKQQSLIAGLVSNAVASGVAKSWGFEPASLALSGFHNELRDLFAVLIENQLDHGKLIVLQESWPRSNFRAAIDLLPVYVDALQKTNQVDPSQLIVMATKFAAGAKSAKVVLVDDAQDLSLAGVEFILQLSSTCQLIACGDPDTASLGFRAAAGGFVAGLRKNRKNLLEVSLTRHTSQPASVNDLMGRLAERIPTSEAFRHRPKSSAKSSTDEFSVFDNQISETDYLASEFRRLRVTEGWDWGQMCVVARTRVQLEQLSSDLAARSIPVRILGVQKALRDQPAARSVLDFGQLVFAEPKHYLVTQLLGSNLIGLSVIQQRRLFRQLSSLEQFESLTRSQMLESIFEAEIDFDSNEVARLNRSIQVLGSLKSNTDMGAYQFVSAIWNLAPAGKLAELSRGESEVALAANRDLDAILELFAAANRFDEQRGTGAQAFFAVQLDAAVPEDSLAQVGLRDSVVLATASQLSGLEFQVLAMPRLQEGIWPNLRSRNSLLGASGLQAFLAGRSDDPGKAARSELADELRLFYKSLGAVRSKLMLSAMQSSDEQPSQFFQMLGLSPVAKQVDIEFDPRRLVGRLRAELAAGDVSAAPMLAALALTGASGAHPRSWQGLLPISTTEPVVTEDEQLRLSASRLDAFEKCPLHWFINNFGGDGQSFEASIGTLLHAAMELSTDSDSVGQYVESNWHTLKFETEWLATAAKRRALKMVGYMSSYLAESNQLVASEQGFEIDLGRLVVAGKIDRVERTGDGLIAADLKTGKSPSAKEAAEHRQLALYQLGLRQSYDEPVAGGRIISVGSGSLKVLEQPALAGEFQESIMELLSRAESQIGQASFVANISEHCTGDSKCQLLMAKAVTHD